MCTKKEAMQPMVSVLVKTYNHALYIRQALDGILMQNVDFKYEIIVHDDASIDKTASILSEYEEKYPQITKVVYQTENQHSQGISTQKHYLKYLTGKYVAICEGDDYWTDTSKLKKQIQFLENNKNFIATAHNVRVIDEHGDLIKEELNPYKIFNSYVFTLRHAEQIKLPGHFASIVYRNIWLNIDDSIIEAYQSLIMNGDNKLAIILALHGEIYCFSDIMANHRKIFSKGTSWTARTHGKNLCARKYISILEINNFVEKYFSVTFNNINFQLNLVYEAFIKLILGVNKENCRVFYKIIKYSKDRRIKIFLHIIKKLVAWPLRKIKKSNANIK